MSKMSKWVKIIIFVLNDLSVLVYTKTIIHTTSQLHFGE